jgi:pilus assembly protein FimV
MALQREQVVRTAEKYASRGRIDAAIREYRKVLAEAPDDVATLNRVGDLLARSDRPDEAIKLYAQVAEQYTAEGFFVKAIAIYKKIIKLDPTRLEIYEKLASLYHRQGLLNEARTQYQVLADYYLKHDNPTSAIAIYERMAEVDPKDPSLRVKLADLYVEMKLPEKALGEYRQIAETMLAAGHPGEAEQVYRRGLYLDASNIGFVTDAVLKLREAGQVGPAARLLAEAVERNPEAARVARLVGMQPARAGGAAVEEAEEEAAEKEAGTEAAAGAEAGADEPAVAEEAEALVLDLDGAEALSPLELEALETFPAPDGAVEVEEEEEAAPPATDEPAAASAAAAPVFDEELELDLDEVFVLDFDEDEEPPDTQVSPPADLAESSEPPPAFRGRAAASPAPRGGLAFDPDVLERTAAEIQPERIRQEEDLLTEAEVLSKYGLAEKAAERLGELLEINPTHVGGLALRVRFHLETGAHAQAASAAERLRTIADERSEAWLATAERLTAAGHEIAADRVVPPPDEAGTLPGARGGDGEAAPPTAGAGDGALDLHDEAGDLFAGLDEIELPASLEVAEEATPAWLDEPAAAAPAEAEPPVAAGGEAASGPAAAAAHAPAAETPETAATGSAAAEEPPPELAAPRPAAAPAAGRGSRRGADVDALLAEIASGVGSRRRPRRATAAPPAAAGPAPAAAATAPPADTPPAEAPPAAAPSADAEAMGWLEEVERATGRIGAAADGDRAATTPGAAEAGDGDAFFSAEDDFFDLAAELEEELSREAQMGEDELLLAQPKEQTLEEIVEGFKRGVSEALSPEDYPTHFDLGIAYREMGLLDEAIGEFQIAAKDPALLVGCCSMLGLSFLEKGLPELAVKWYRRGLEQPNVGEDDQLGLLYDLGNAHSALGDRPAAYQVFVELYGINSHYRDVVARLEETRPAR